MNGDSPSPDPCEDTDEIHVDLHEDEINKYNKRNKKCELCIKNDKLKQKNIVINNAWMVWEYFVIMSDFVTDFYIIYVYLTDTKTFYDGIALVIILLISTIFHAYESYLCAQPWYVWFSCGGLYETYQSWGCPIPTIKWDEFRYTHCVSESLPQTIVQSIIMIKNAPNDDYIQHFNVNIIRQYSRRYFAEVILSNPCSEESLFRMSVMIFLYTDTLLRVVALSLFVNVEAFAPWSWLIVAFLFPIYIIYQWSDHTFIQSLFQGFVSLFANDALLELNRNENTSERLQQMVFNMVVVSAFLMSSLFAMNQGQNIIFWTSIAMLIINVIFMVPAVWYMYFRKELTEKWNNNNNNNNNKCEQCDIYK